METNKPKPYQVWLFTNRNCMIFDRDGRQIPEDQAAISCYTLDKEVALRITQEAEEFHIAKWKGSEIPITREEMQYLLGLRTKEMDLADQEKKRT